MKGICWCCLELAFSVQIWLSVRCPRPCEKVLTVKNWSLRVTI